MLKHNKEFAHDKHKLSGIHDGSIYYSLRIDPPSEGGKMSSFVNLDGGWEPRASAIVPEVNKWYHYAVTYNSGTGKLTVFADGAKAGESDRVGNPTSNNEPVTFGRWGDGNFFFGLIDEVAVFNVALSEADIKSIADNGLANILGLGEPSSVKPFEKITTTWDNLK